MKEFNQTAEFIQFGSVLIKFKLYSLCFLFRTCVIVFIQNSDFFYAVILLQIPVSKCDSVLHFVMYFQMTLKCGRGFLLM